MLTILKSMLFKNIFNYKGKITRKEYSLSVLYSIVLILIMSIPSSLVLFFLGSSIALDIVNLIFLLTLLWIFVSFLGLNSRRLRDAGKSQLWLLALYSPVVATVPLLNDAIARQILAFVFSPFLITALFFIFFTKSKEPDTLLKKNGLESSHQSAQEQIIHPEYYAARESLIQKIVLIETKILGFINDRDTLRITSRIRGFKNVSNMNLEEIEEASSYCDDIIIQYRHLL